MGRLRLQIATHCRHHHHHRKTMAGNAEWLEAKSKEEGVTSTASGLMYKVLKSGDAAGPSPSVSTPCLCHYHGTLTNGTVFDSSENRGTPIEFAPNQVIGAWTEAMQLMKQGDQWELYCKPELAYGARGSPPKIPPNSVLVFRMQIVQIGSSGGGGWCTLL